MGRIAGGITSQNFCVSFFAHGDITRDVRACCLDTSEKEFEVSHVQSVIIRCAPCFLQQRRSSLSEFDASRVYETYESFWSRHSILCESMFRPWHRTRASAAIPAAAFE